MSIHTACTLFPPNKRLLVSLLSIFVGILFHAKPKNQGLVTDHWSSGYRIQCSHCRNQASISGREPKPSFKPLQAEISLTECWAHKLEFNKNAVHSKSLQLCLTKRICLPMQETRVQGIPSPGKSHNATKPLHHNYWAHALEPLSCNCRSLCAWSPRNERSLCTSVKSRPHSPQSERAYTQQ